MGVSCIDSYDTLGYMYIYLLFPLQLTVMKFTSQGLQIL